jgi:hypothetical protein
VDEAQTVSQIQVFVLEGVVCSFPEKEVLHTIFYFLTG